MSYNNLFRYSMQKEEILNLVEKDFEFKDKLVDLLYPEILKKLPILLKGNPELKNEFLQLFTDTLPTRGDLVAILEELKNQREDANRRFEALIKEMNQRFEAVDKRFEQMYKELRELREDTNCRFEALIKEMNQRFEAVDKRFEALIKEINQRFEAVDKRFEALIKEINQRFEEVNRRFEEINRRFEAIIKEMRDGFDIIRKELEQRTSALGLRWGVGAEEAFRKGLEELLSTLGYKVIKWRYRDSKCEVFSIPRDVEIDILIRDEKKIAIEIKSSLTIGEVEIFQKSVKFYQKEEKEKLDEKIIITIYPYPGVEEYANLLGIKIIKGQTQVGDYLK